MTENYRYFLLTDKIKGPVSLPGLIGAIKLESAVIGGPERLGGGGAGFPAVYAPIQTVIVTRFPDIFSALLMSYCFTGDHIDKITVKIMQKLESGALASKVTATLKDCTISHFALVSKPGTKKQIEELTLACVSSSSDVS